MTGIERINAERQRQQDEEGWDINHDAQHKCGELAAAARCYLQRANQDPALPVPAVWPWAASWWKPKDRIRNLERAGALYQAEIDRLEFRLETMRQMRDQCAEEIDNVLRQAAGQPEPRGET